MKKYAVTEYNSKGRVFPVSPAKDRNAFQRDYTRILHSRSFRKLQGKTQVFPAEYNPINNELFTNDFFSKNIPNINTYRTRMSHSFEVEQIARSIGRALEVNQDLCATLAIGHDIGHPPFGHTGQDVLNKLFKNSGGFEHNLQALRIVDEIESPYPDYNGLNLMFETREGLLKHCSVENAKKLGRVAKHHIDGTSPTLEAQIVDISDQLAYLYGDIEDAIDKNLFDYQFLIENMPGFKNKWENLYKTISNKTNSLDFNIRLTREVLRQMLSMSINDVIVHSKALIELENPLDLNDIRNSFPLIKMSDKMKFLNKKIRIFSRKYIYGNEKIISYRKMEEKALIDLYNDVKKSYKKFGLLDNKDDTIKNWLSGQTDQSVMIWWERKNKLINGFDNKKTKSSEQKIKSSHLSDTDKETVSKHNINYYMSV